MAVQGYEKLMAQLKRLSTMKFSTEEAAKIVLQKAKELVPVDTGNLRDSGIVADAGEGFQVEFQADYAAFVEFGTSIMQAQPYLRPAIDSTQNEVLKAEAVEVEKEIKEKL